ncbi:unnamed protein product [Paramecium primaurelia]|uniref:Uncharacterized protein n=1 Tax=Paramecium primaurelia TaxID=5886 RepID=A0A8S1PVG2_PARPR|nr:unnamed protein product [Paramecium primaurelia]
MYQKSSLKKQNNDIPDHYHLDENQEQEYNSVCGYNSYGIPQYHQLPINVYMILPQNYQENFDTNLPYIQYPPQPQTPIRFDHQPLKQIKAKKLYKRKQATTITQSHQSVQQQFQRTDESEHEIWPQANFEIDQNENEKKLLFQQTLTGFVLKLFEAHQNATLSERYIVEQVRSNLCKLKRLDGSKYKGNLYKTVKGSLTSNGIFRVDQKKENESYWIVCQSAADEFQKRTIERIQTTDKKKPSKKIKMQEDSQQNKEIQDYIKYDFAHAYGLLNGFLETQPNLKTFIEQIDQNDLERNRNLRNYNLDLVSNGIKECQDFFDELIKKQKNEIMQN